MNVNNAPPHPPPPQNLPPLPPSAIAPLPKKHPPTTPAPSTLPPPPPNPGPNTVRPPPPTPNSNVPNGTTAPPKSKKKAEPAPPDPAIMYENLKNRIDALEKAHVLYEEEDRRVADDARKSVKGLSDSAIQTKYIELFQEMKRLERDHAREKQKLTKEKDASKSQLTKTNQAKTKLESLARELQKDNKKLREDTKDLRQSIEGAQEEIILMKSEMERRLEKSKKRAAAKKTESLDVVVKVVCKYRAELVFKISRKTKLSKLFNAWTDRMETSPPPSSPAMIGSSGSVHSIAGSMRSMSDKDRKGSTSAASLSIKSSSPITFMFTHLGRTLEPDRTLDEAGIEDNDEILAVELMDLTESDSDDIVPEVQRGKLRKNWTDNPAEAKQSLAEIFDGVVRERLKDVLRQYELRERHFEKVVKSKELEVLLSKARAEEQKQLAEGERQIATVAETQNQQIRQQMEDMQNSQARLMDKLIACCKEPTGERTQRLFAFLREELEKRGAKAPDIGLVTNGGKDEPHPCVIHGSTMNGDLVGGDGERGLTKALTNGTPSPVIAVATE